MEKSNNKKIIYDYHNRDSVELIYLVDTTVGKNACMTSCEHCFFKNNKFTINNIQDIDLAKNMIDKLKKQNYTVIPIVSDTFAQNGKYLIEGFYRNFYEKNSTNMAWTSGMPLIKNNALELLQLEVENNINMIVMTSHSVKPIVFTKCQLVNSSKSLENST